MNPILEQISLLGIVPVIALDNVEDALPLAKALYDGGLPCAEVTFRTTAAEEAIQIMTEAYPDMLVGAGTVLTTEQVDRAMNAGAKFIVSPGFNPKIVSYCVSKNIPITPGCSSPSDIEQALEHGLEVVKFFPAEASGGLAKIKAMAAPYTKIKFMPTGGINAKNLNSYLEYKKIIACGGSWMVNKDLLKAKDFNGIKKLTEEAIHLMLGFELRHIGINTNNENEATSVADYFDKMFGFSKIVGSSSIFAGSGVEVLKSPYLGKNGHIAVQTNDVKRAMYHLSKRGVEFDMNTANYDNNGSVKTVYMKDEVGGFAIHLIQK
ncbi:MAG: bifunctional 4-hydroxy-2-oxoglutarate aldolase/2-dehydro-3-deoxy-phosphogluconate aldolase [Clostridiales bacterium]|nr:bifunctional 4-hydroxy-2-oxoglutarate aldolase/2-dehydro-3-deoxy-phosphogluconate aldolase [Clostridiales bacterium]